MTDLLLRIVSIPPPFNMVVIVTIVGCSVAIIGIIASEARKYACHRQDVALKRDLVERGLSAEEIERIVKVRSVDPENTADA